VADYARQTFERFDDKHVLVIGAGEMAEETLRYLIDAGARDITVINRSQPRAEELVLKMQGRVRPWEQLHACLVAADLVVSATGATEPIIAEKEFKRIVSERYQRPLMILDLAIPRDFDPAIGDLPGVYLYTIDDLTAACQRNRREREKEWPKAERIIDEETARFMADLHHRATAPTIRRLKARADEVKSEELKRLLARVSQLEPQAQEEIRMAFDRLVNKLLHPPLESLRDEAAQGAPHGLLEALKRLFQLKE
jgi:glutamyl-tRNA reductase